MLQRVLFRSVPPARLKNPLDLVFLAGFQHPIPGAFVFITPGFFASGCRHNITYPF
jgi:hypothetical protein